MLGHDACYTVALWRADGVPHDAKSNNNRERLFPHIPDWSNTGRLCSWSETSTRPLTFCLLLNGRNRTNKQSNEEYDAVTGGVGHVTLWYIQGESLLPSKSVSEVDLRGIMADPIGKAWMNNEGPINRESSNRESSNCYDDDESNNLDHVTSIANDKNNDDNDSEEDLMSSTYINNVLCSCIVMGKEIVTGDSLGSITMWHTAYGDPVAIREKAHEGEIWCIASSGEVIVTGGEDGYVRVWNIELNCIGARSFPVNDMSTGSPVNINWSIRSLSCIELRHSSLRVALVTEDCRMYTFALPGAGNNATEHLIQEAHHSKELCSMSPSPINDDIFVTGGDDRTLRIWSISTLSVTQRRQLPSMIRAICWSPNGELIACGQGGGSTNAEDRRLDGSWVILRSSDLRVMHHGRNSTQYITTIQYSPNGKHLAVGSLDSVINVYDVIRGYILHSVCNDFNGFVSQLDWSKDSKYLRCNSGFFELCFYDVIGSIDFDEGDDAISMTPKEARDVLWSTNTCTLSWSTLGVWPTDRQQIQVNTVDVAMNKCRNNNEKGLIATGNDDGIIKLFRYPAPNRVSYTYFNFLHFKFYSSKETILFNMLYLSFTLSFKVCTICPINWPWTTHFNGEMDKR